jgi:hypothetical protein
MLTRDEALTICETVLGHARSAGAEDATVSVQSTVESHARFADNRITTRARKRRGHGHRLLAARGPPRQYMPDGAENGWTRRSRSRASPAHREHAPARRLTTPPSGYSLRHRKSI